MAKWITRKILAPPLLATTGKLQVTPALTAPETCLAEEGNTIAAGVMLKRRLTVRNGGEELSVHESITGRWSKQHTCSTVTGETVITRKKWLEASISEMSTELGGSASSRNQRYCGDKEQNILIEQHCAQLKGVRLARAIDD